MSGSVTVHPELRSSVFRNTCIGAPLFGLAGLGVLLRSAWSYWHGSLAPGMLLLNASIGTLLLWAGWFMWRSRVWYAHVSWLLASTVHTPMRVSFTTNERGTLAARLHRVSDGQLQHPRIWFLCVRPAWNVEAIVGEVVKAHVDAKPGGPVVLQTSLGILWPLERVPRQDLVEPRGAASPP